MTSFSTGAAAVAVAVRRSSAAVNAATESDSRRSASGVSRVRPPSPRMMSESRRNRPWTTWSAPSAVSTGRSA
ncbi:hypothetical protein ACFQ9X_46960 [Catenulispora yoronensis]